MSDLTLTLKDDFDSLVDLSSLTPASVAGLTQAELKKLKLPLARGRATLGDVFTIRGSASETLVIEGLDARAHGIGATLDAGRLDVSGDVGNEAGLRMTGGELAIRGSAGDFLGSAMKGGTITLRGNAGDYVGGALPASPRGMAGGAIVVTGNVGDYAGNRMRRGTLIVTGDAGAHAGARMLAGTLFIGGGYGDGLGFNARRGTIAVSEKNFVCPAWFAPCGPTESIFLSLFRSHLKQFSKRAATLVAKAPVTDLYRGDIANGGLGELLVFATP